MPVVNGRWVPSGGSADGSGYRGFNALVNEALENKYNDIYQNIPTNTTLRITQITSDPSQADNIIDYNDVPPMPKFEAPKIPAPPRGFYESLDSKLGGVLPGGTGFKPSDYGISEKFAKNNPTISRGLATIASPLKAVMDNPFADRSSQAAGEIVTTVDNPNMASTGSKGWDTAADLLGGIGGFVLNPTGGVRSAGAQLFGAGEKAIERGLGLGNLPGMVKGLENLPGVVKTGIKLGGATIPYEATMAAVNDREFSPSEAGMAGAANAIIGMALHGAGSVLNKRNTPTVPTEFKMPEYKAPDMSGFTPEELANIRSQSRLMDSPIAQNAPAEMPAISPKTAKEVAAARQTLRSTLSVEKANKVLDEFPELESKFPYFRLKQGDTVILPNGKEGTVKTADKMIIQVDVGGKTVSIGRKVVKVPEVKAEVPEVVPETKAEAMPENVVPDIATEIEQFSKPASGTTMAEDIGLKPEKVETYDDGTIGAES